MIKFENVTFAYRNSQGEVTPVFENLSLEIPDSGITAVIAPSGVGKTTLLRLLAGLEKPDDGAVTVSPEGAKTAYVFQEQRLLPWFSALENIRTVCGVSDETALSMLNDLGIDTELAAKRPAELSGGQRQRVCLSRALLFEGDILLLDEPFTGLDSENREIVIGKIKEFAESKPVILVSHIKDDINIADKVIEL